MLDRVYMGVSVRALAREVAVQRSRGQVVLAEQAWRQMVDVLPFSDELCESLIAEVSREMASTSPRWKVDASEVPPELRDNFIVDYLVGLTPEQEASLGRADELDRAEGDGRPEED